MLDKLPLGMKITGLAGGSFLLMSVLFLIGLVKMNSRDNQSQPAASHEMPIKTVLIEITVHRLEQANTFERAVRFADNPQERACFHKAKNQFERFSTLLDDEIKNAIRFTDDGSKHTVSIARRNELKELRTYLQAVAHEHGEYEKKAKSAFKKIQSGDINGARAISESLSNTRHKLHKDLKRILVEFEKFSENSLHLVRKDAQKNSKKLSLPLLLGLITCLSLGIFIPSKLLKTLLKRNEHQQMSPTQKR